MAMKSLQRDIYNRRDIDNAMRGIEAIEPELTHAYNALRVALGIPPNLPARDVVMVFQYDEVDHVQ